MWPQQCDHIRSCVQLVKGKARGDSVNIQGAKKACPVLVPRSAEPFLPIDWGQIELSCDRTVDIGSGTLLNGCKQLLPPSQELSRLREEEAQSCRVDSLRAVPKAREVTYLDQVAPQLSLASAKQHSQVTPGAGKARRSLTGCWPTIIIEASSVGYGYNGSKNST